MHKAFKTRVKACSTRKYLEIRCSEIPSESITAQKQSCSAYLAWFAKPAQIIFPSEKALQLAEADLARCLLSIQYKTPKSQMCFLDENKCM